MSNNVSAPATLRDTEWSMGGSEGGSSIAMAEVGYARMGVVGTTL